MSTVLLDTTVQRLNRGLLLALPGVGAVTCGVALGVNLFAGLDSLPPGIAAATPWFVVGLVVLGALTGWLWWRGRMRLAVVERDGRRYLEVYDPRAPLVMELPVAVRCGYLRQHVTHGGSMTVVIAGFYEDGRCRLSLSETWGTLYDPPAGWSEGVQLDPAEAGYEAAGRSFITELVSLATAPTPG